MSTLITLWTFLSLSSGTVGGAAPTPAYTAENINAAIERQIGFVSACMAAHPAAPGAHGGKRLRLRFVVGSDGRVERTAVEHDSLDSHRATACIERVAHTWRFPAPPAADAQFEYTFRFRH
jgi:hypothetical protein